MARPPKKLGNYKSISCASCNKEVQEGFGLSLSLTQLYVTPDFFISSDSDIEDYDAYFCSKECIIKYIKEVLHVNRNGE